MNSLAALTLSQSTDNTGSQIEVISKKCKSSSKKSTIKSFFSFCYVSQAKEQRTAGCCKSAASSCSEKQLSKDAPSFVRFVAQPFMRSSETTPSNIAGSSSWLAAVRQAD